MPPLFVDTDDWEGEGGMNALHSYSYAEKRLFAFQEQWLSCNAAGVSVASRELERLTRDLGVTKEHIFYLPNGVEKSVPGDGLRIRKKLSIPNDAPVMLLYTRFFEFTQERVHRVFAEIFRRVPGVRFLIVGKGRHGEEERLRTAARENGFFEVLIMAGWVEPHELPDYLAAADVAIYPMDDTLVNRAKCPAKLTEIILAGIPVVADGVGQAREYIHDPDLLSNHLDESDMVDKVVAVLAGKSGTKLSGEAGRQHILERYNWHDIANGVSQFYSLFRGDKK
jgi:glycosyltransferase involved in cell wall biosynthesis